MGTKAKILLAGVTVNLITGLILFTLLALIGMPKLLSNQYTYKDNTKLIAQKVMVNDVVTGSPAAKAGLKVGDQLTELSLPNNKKVSFVTSANDMRSITKKYANQVVDIHYLDNGQAFIKQVRFLPRSSSYQLGVATQQLNLYRSTWSAPIVALGLGGQLIWATIIGLGHSLAGLGSIIAGIVTHNDVARHNGQTAAVANLTGPVGIYAILYSSSAMGYQFVLFIVAYISLVLAFMNILPIPIVDGGRLYLTLISRFLKRPISAKREEAINMVSIVLLLLLFVLITIADVKRYY